jgi:hypothetical protein
LGPFRISRPAPYDEAVWQDVVWGLAERLGSPGHRDDAEMVASADTRCGARVRWLATLWEGFRGSGSTETKTYGKSTTVRAHEEQQTLPRRSFFGKGGDER